MDKSKCPICKKICRKSALNFHLEQSHTQKEREEYKENNRLKNSSKFVICEVCEEEVMERSLKEHIRRYHSDTLINTPKPLTRRQKLNKKLYPDERPILRDLLDTNLVVSGGGVGVGKGKKK